MEEKDIFMSEGATLSQDDAARPEPETRNAEADMAEQEQQKAAREKMEQIFKTVSANKSEPVTAEKEETKTEKQENLEKTEKTEKQENAQSTEQAEPVSEESNSAPSQEIELMTVEKLTSAQRRDMEKQKQVAEKKEKYKKIAKKLVPTVFIIALVALCGVLYAEYMPNRQSGEVVFTIPKGAGTEQIAKILKRENLIHSETFFRVASKVRGVDGKYNMGKFKLDRSAGYEDIFVALTQSGHNVDAVKVTIPEGYEIYKIADLLESKGLIDKDKFYYLVDFGEFDYAFVKDIPVRENRLEGYLYPDTYEFAPGDEYGIINEMLLGFEKMYTKYESRAGEMNMTMDEVITLASIIEREAQGDSDRKLVSSVFHNRINSTDYPYLQSCATVQYVLKERKPVLTVDDTKIDSPYNTYINKGLPVGPIASPGEKSVEAALYPEDTNYLFFVLGSDGKHHFSATYQEHVQHKNN